MAITPETLRIINEAKEGLQRITDEHTNQLVGACVAAWDDLKPEFEASLVDLMIDAKDGYVSRAAAAKHKMLTATLELAASRLVELADGI